MCEKRLGSLLSQVSDMQGNAFGQGLVNTLIIGGFP